MLFLVHMIMLAAFAAVSGDLTDEEYAKFPRLYHLDDYDSCFLHTGGLYCLGTFQISPLKESDPTFIMLKKYSLDPNHFNRTELHRGYCVSLRCPKLRTERNASFWFERCVAQRAHRRDLHTTLTKLHYCRSYAQELAQIQNPEPVTIPQKTLLWVLVMLTAMNIVGTTYDVLMGDMKKSQLLMTWSVRSNWQRLTTTYKEEDQRLSALSFIPGIRVIFLTLAMLVHNGLIYNTMYLDNPRKMEQAFQHPAMMLILNGTTVVLVFVMLSSFLLAYNQLLSSRNNAISIKMLPALIMKRIARTLPLYLLVVGYAATWWVLGGSGPMWPASVEPESQICREKFWTHMFYVNNLIHPENICLLQSWYLAVDMQLYLVAAVLTLTLAHLKKRALPVLAALVVVFSVLNGALAYVFNWQSIVYYIYPQTASTMFRGIPSFVHVYQSPWGSLPVCLVGLFIAFLQIQLQESRIKMTSYRWLKLLYCMTVVAMPSWVMSGIYIRQNTEPWFVATYAAMERPVLIIMLAFIFIGLINGLGGWVLELLSWRGWNLGGRMSLAVMLVHWCVNVNIVAARRHVLAVTALSVMIDGWATVCMSFALAVPLTVMVEIPVQRFINTLFLRKL